MDSTEAGRVGFEHWEQLLSRLRQLVRVKTTNSNKTFSFKTRILKKKKIDNKGRAHSM